MTALNSGWSRAQPSLALQIVSVRQCAKVFDVQELRRESYQLMLWKLQRLNFYRRGLVFVAVDGELDLG